MRYLITLSFTMIFTHAALANTNQDTIHLCSSMLQKKQQELGTPKITDAQANAYCKCIVPKIESLKKGTTLPSQEELHKEFNNCMDKAGIKQLPQ